MSKPLHTTIKEDAVECWLYYDQSSGSKLISDINQILSDYTKHYLWNKDAFNINFPVDQNKELPPHLYGITFYGDNIEDEWFIVYLIFEITKLHPTIIAQVQDNDGEFILIEAANGLPDWVNPDTAQNRVFISNAEVHLIPHSQIDAEEDVDISKALECIRKHSKETRASDEIQKSIHNRISGYPEKIRESQHRACVKIPANIASILIAQPSLISPVIHAFCNRDSLESKICKKTKLENCVETSLTFTKCLYAMLAHSSLPQQAVWRLPPKSSSEYKKNVLGVKIACGFEILMSKATNDSFSGKEWNVYFDSLKKNGYFKENIEGSKEYVKLLDAAKQYFVYNKCSNINSHIANTINELILSDKFKDISDNLSQFVTVDEESDEWLNVDPEELNSLMFQRYGKAKKYKKNDIITPQNITNELSLFLNQTSDLDGIELTSQAGDDAGDLHEDKINFNTQEFSACIQNILASLENIDGTESEEYDLSDHSMEDEDLKYEKILDDELANSALSDSFIKRGTDVDVLENAYVNLSKSIKEEKGAPGPTSTLLSNLGFNKCSLQVLDSDDDEE